MYVRVDHAGPVPRHLTPAEINELLAADTIARLATIDKDGYPHVTALWFLYEHDTFSLTSDASRPHLTRIRANPKVGLLIDTEQPERQDGERPNRQVRIVGQATLAEDRGGVWTARIWAKYRRRPTDPSEIAQRLRGRRRVLISVPAQDVTAVASL